MANEFVQILGSTSTNVTVSNTAAMTSIFASTIPGGSLDEHNKIRWDMQGLISFSDQDEECSINSFFGGITVTSCTVKNIGAGARLNKAVRIIAEVSGDGSVNSQCGLVHSFIGLPRNEDGSTPVGFGSCGVSSNGDQTFEIKVQWGGASSNNSITHSHSTLELLSYVEDTAIDDLDDPTAYIFINSKLNNLRYTLRKDAYFYAALEYELDFYGYGDVTFTRNSTSTATYADGVSHSVAINEPRFEYSGSTVMGLAINTATETLTFSTSNSLSDSNTICWRENGTFKSTTTNTNPFNGSGVYIGTSGTHLTQVIKFNRVLTNAEINEVNVMTS